MHATVLAIGVRPEVKDLNLRDSDQSVNHLVEGLAAIGFASKHVHTARQAVDGLVLDDATICADASDFLINERIDSIVPARQNCVRDRVLFWK